MTIGPMQGTLHGTDNMNKASARRVIIAQQETRARASEHNPDWNKILKERRESMVRMRMKKQCYIVNLLTF